MYSRVIYSGEMVAIQFHKVIVKAPIAYTDAFEFICNVDSEFSVADISTNLDDDRKIALVKRLMRDGLLFEQNRKLNSIKIPNVA